MKKKLIKALSFLQDGEKLELGEDTFLTQECDGADKLYGFFMVNRCLMVEERSGTYPIDEMETQDLKYIFNSSNIYYKILDRKYLLTTIQ